jgi:hypothetical protein
MRLLLTAPRMSSEDRPVHCFDVVRLHSEMQSVGFLLPFPKNQILFSVAAICLGIIVSTQRRLRLFYSREYLFAFVPHSLDVVNRIYVFVV